MRYRKVYDTRLQAEARIVYADQEKPVVLLFPFVYARQAHNVAAVLQGILTSTRPSLDPAEQSLYRALLKAAQAGKTLRRLREGDQVWLELPDNRGTIGWQTSADGTFNVIQ